MKKFLSVFFSAIIVISSLFTFSNASFASQSGIKAFDVSEHNGVVNFEKCKENGYSYVYIRLGYYNHLDTMFYQNVESATKAGLNFGVYEYSYAFNTSEAKEEANFVLATLASLSDEQKQKMTLPVAYDVEDASIRKKCSKTAITNQIITFSKMIYAKSYVPMLYANDDWFKNYINTSTVHSYGIKTWYANYNISGNPASVYIGKTGVLSDIWQYAEGNIAKNTFDKNVIFNLSSLVKSPIQMADVSLSKTTYVYSGKKNVPNASVKRAGKSLNLNLDYSVSVSGNVNVGTGSVQVSGKGGYTGKTLRYFTVLPKGTTVKSLSKPAKKQIKVNINKQSTQTTGYQIQYSTSKTFKNGVKLVTLRSNTYTSYTIKNLPSKKGYYFRVRTYKAVGNKNYFSAWSSARGAVVK